jgi:hypothetical protein
MGVVGGQETAYRGQKKHDASQQDELPDETTGRLLPGDPSPRSTAYTVALSSRALYAHLEGWHDSSLERSYGHVDGLNSRVAVELLRNRSIFWLPLEN